MQFNKPRIIQINATYGIGSTGQLCKELAESDLNKHYEFFTAYSQPTPQPPSNAINYSNLLDRKLHALGARITGKPGYFSHSNTKKLIASIAKIKPSAVHLHNLHSNDINLELLFTALKILKTPVIITLHDCWPFTAKCTHYHVAKCAKWQSSCGGCPQRTKDQPSWFFDRTEALFHDKLRWYSELDALHIIGVSDWITAEARKAPILRSARSISRIYNWIDTDRFKPHPDRTSLRARYGYTNTLNILTVASRWNENKGIIQLTDLAANLPENWTLTVVGELPQNSLIPRQPRVMHHRSLDSQELVEIYNTAHIYLSLSAQESFGLTIAEALSCGTPVVALNETSSAELINSEIGEKISQRDRTSVIKAIQRLQNRLAEQDFQESCRNSALQRFSKKEVLKEISNLYETVTSERNAH